MTKSQILVVEDSEMTLFKIKAILLRLGYDVTTYTNGADALEWLKSSGVVPSLILSDVNMPGMNGYDFIRKVRSNFLTAHTPVMMLTSQNDVADRVAGLEAGADDYVAKTITPTELDLRIKALLARVENMEGALTQSAAKMITVFSLRGGVGTSTLAVNLSIALTQLWGVRVGLWDMALSNAHCAFLLNLKPKMSLAALSDWKEGSLDDETIHSFLMQHESGIQLMPGPATAADAELITPAIVDQVLPTLEGGMDYLVVDGGHHFTEPVLNLIERSDKIVIPLPPELASVKSTFDLLQIFDKLGIDPAKVYPVVNTTFPNGALPGKRIEAALHKTIVSEIPFDSDALIQSINSGKPILAGEPKAPVSIAITALAYKLTAVEMESDREKKGAPGSPTLEGIRRFVRGTGSLNMPGGQRNP
jgi:pilus assembly protein CpaE